MAFITLTTIGFAEVHNLSMAGRMFTILIAFVGIGSVAFVASRVAGMVLMGHVIRQKNIARKIKKMRNHYIICGYGRIGKRMVSNLTQRGKDVIVLERNSEIVHDLTERGIPVVHGNASDERALERAGIKVAQGLITVLPVDGDNVFVTLVARDLNPDLFILARTTYTRNRRKLLQAGATEVVAPSDVGADRMAQVILRPNVDRFMTHVIEVSNASLMMEEVKVKPGSLLAGKTLADSRFRQNFESIVIAVIKESEETMRFNPGPHERIDAGDILIVIGSSKMTARLEAEACSP